MPYLNFHTHKPAQDAICNVIAGQEKVPASGWFSAGVHPMHLSSISDFDKCMPVVAADKRCLLIGECGLDKRAAIPMSRQLEVFQKHIELAESLQKPLLIHCVRAHNELLQIRKERLFSIPWILHGFNQNAETGKRLLHAGCYFSLGKALLQPLSNASKLLPYIPLHHLFLETDDAPISIEPIYRAAASILQLEVSDLQVTIRENLSRMVQPA